MTPPPDLSTLSPSEKDTLISVLIARLDAVEAENALLREKLNLPPKTPDNSSKPPSQGQKPNGETKAKPKGKAHAGAHRPLHPNPTRRQDVLAEYCPHCRADVAGVVQAEVHAYDRIEIPEITPDVTRVTLFGGTCPCCARRFKATPPAGLEPGSPFGPNLRAFVLYLRFGQAIPFERLERLLLGLDISEGALANMLEDSAPAFAAQTDRIKARLLSGAAMESDETSVRVGKRTFWNWVFHHGDSACFLIRPSRGKKVVAEFLGEVRPDFRVSDRLAAQMGWAAKDHQACLAHLLRDIQYAIDAGDDALAPGLKALLKRATRIGRRRPDLADSTLAVYHSRLQSRLDDLLKIVPATKAGQKLLRIIKRFRQNLFVFVTNRAIPATNNGSEQALRPCVVFRKVTNCFRSEWGATLYANVRSVVETARRRGIGILRAIRLTLDGAALPVAS
ncbi:IS66 family transposase [Tistrella bauzanensis]|uniref:IS66 family transposase n=1 Tax=Tistrella bauzanensis TaxID=657419 RepID=UPI003557BE1A